MAPHNRRLTQQTNAPSQADLAAVSCRRPPPCSKLLSVTTRHPLLKTFWLTHVYVSSPLRAPPGKLNRCPLDDADPLTMQQKLEQKRLEHEKQRALQKKAFEEQVSLPVR